MQTNLVDRYGVILQKEYFRMMRLINNGKLTFSLAHFLDLILILTAILEPERKNCFLTLCNLQNLQLLFYYYAYSIISRKKLETEIILGDTTAQPGKSIFCLCLTQEFSERKNIKDYMELLNIVQMS